MYLLRFRTSVIVYLFIACGFISLIVYVSTVRAEKNKIFNKRSTRANISQTVDRKRTHVDYQSELSLLNNRQTLSDDPRLLALIRDYFITPPSREHYNLQCKDCLDNSRGQAPFVDNRLGYKENGVFVESGAYDGETLSNTLMLERMRHWSGVLIEPSPEAFKSMIQKHRKAYVINACLSTEPYPLQKLLVVNTLQSRLFPLESSLAHSTNQTVFRVQCFPLYSILLALNMTNVDYLSLDVEGDEYGVLETIPWHKVNIQMVSAEYDKWSGGSRSLCRYMEAKGYECLLTMSGQFVSDAIFRKRTIHRKRYENHRRYQ